jgi:peptide chain release factor
MLIFLQNKIFLFNSLKFNLYNCLKKSSKGVFISFYNFSTRSHPSTILYREEDIKEIFVRGSGSGGQSVAKTSNCVQLLHVPSGIQVRCHKTRSRDLNRKEARRLLQLQLEDKAFGSLSKRAIKEAKRKKSKLRSYAKSKAKHLSKISSSSSLLEKRRARPSRFELRLQFLRKKKKISFGSFPLSMSKNKFWSRSL